jgi:hypothetical protein
MVSKKKGSRIWTEPYVRQDIRSPGRLKSRYPRAIKYCPYCKLKMDRIIGNKRIKLKCPNCSYVKVLAKQSKKKSIFDLIKSLVEMAI